MAPWTFAERRRFLEIAASSKPLEELVHRTGRTRKGIRQVALKLGVSLKFDQSAPKLTTKGK
jgi:hypothetical protein